MTYPPSWSNAFFARVLGVELIIMKKEINLPFSGSRLMPAQKI